MRGVHPYIQALSTSALASNNTLAHSTEPSRAATSRAVHPPLTPSTSAPPTMSAFNNAASLLSAAPCKDIATDATFKVTAPQKHSGQFFRSLISFFFRLPNRGDFDREEKLGGSTLSARLSPGNPWIRMVECTRSPWRHCKGSANLPWGKGAFCCPA